MDSSKEPLDLQAEILIAKLIGMGNPYDPVMVKVCRLLPFLGDLSDDTRTKLAKALRKRVEGDMRRVRLVSDAFERESR